MLAAAWALAAPLCKLPRPWYDANMVACTHTAGCPRARCNSRSTALHADIPCDDTAEDVALALMTCSHQQQILYSAAYLTQ